MVAKAFVPQCLISNVSITKHKITKNYKTQNKYIISEVKRFLKNTQNCILKYGRWYVFFSTHRSQNKMLKIKIEQYGLMKYILYVCEFLSLSGKGLYLTVAEERKRLAAKQNSGQNISRWHVKKVYVFN